MGMSYKNSAYTMVNLSFIRNSSIYSLYDKETYTNSLQRYCTKVYTVKAERAIQIHHTNTHKHFSHTGTQHQCSLQMLYILANHTRTQQRASRETSKIHDQRHLFIQKKDIANQSDLNTKQTVLTVKRKKSTVECLKIRLGCEIFTVTISPSKFVLL